MVYTSPAKILIVDDLPEKHLVYRTVLDELGQDLVAVSSGPEALRQILKHDFAVILLDVQMPEMDGFETATLIRARKRSAHTPIIFLTAFADEVKTAQGYATGAVDYIPTPVVPDILRAKVRVFIDLFHMRHRLAQQAEEAGRRVAAEDSARRYAFLADSSRALANSLDFEATLRELVRLPLGHLADVCLVTLAADPAGAGRTDFAWAAGPAGSLPDGALLADWVAAAVGRVMASGAAETLAPPAAPAPLFRPPAPGEDGGPPADVPAAVSVTVLPLVARGATLGALTLAAADAGRRWGPADAALAQELAGRAGIALDNALLVRNVQENDRRKGEFLATLAHELRNPLAPIRNALQIIGLAGDNRRAVDKARAMMERQLNQMVRLVDDLLDVSRINRNKLELRCEHVGVAAVIENAVETSRPLIEEAGHRLTVSPPAESVRVLADPTRLAQVFSNLLNNAAKYTDRGGNIALTAGCDAGDVVVRVRDDGIGIPADALPRVFDLFSQVDRHQVRAQGGLGIGLSLVRRLVELHGGTVEARSGGPGQGSEFVVRIPHAGDDCEPAAAPPAPVSAAATGKHRILVADDNADSAQSLGMMLEMMGFEVRTAHNGEEAVATAAAFRPHIALLDIGMPKLNGHDAARRIRAEPWGRDTVLIAQTGWGQPDDRDKSKAAGFDHHLVKPVDPAALQALLRDRGR